MPGKANVCVIAPMKRKIHHFGLKQSASLCSSHRAVCVCEPLTRLTYCNQRPLIIFNLFIFINADIMSEISHSHLRSRQWKRVEDVYGHLGGRTESCLPRIGSGRRNVCVLILGSARTCENTWGDLLRSCTLSCIPNQGQRGGLG